MRRVTVTVEPWVYGDGNVVLKVILNEGMATEHRYERPLHQSEFVSLFDLVMDEAKRMILKSMEITAP